MNQREKVIEAVRRLNKSMEDKAAAECTLHKMQLLVNDARANLIKTMHAVYGDRSQHGVVIDGHLYRIVEDSLAVIKVEFEVLS